MSYDRMTRYVFAFFCLFCLQKRFLFVFEYMIEDHGRVKAECKGTKWEGGDTNSRLELRVGVRSRGEGNMEVNWLHMS